MRQTKDSQKANCEDQLAARAQAGDTDACSRLLLKYRKAMYRCAFKYANHRIDADDLVHECFMRLLRLKFRAFDPERATFSTWIHIHIRGVIQKVAQETGSRRRRHVLSACTFSQMGKSSEGDFADTLESKYSDRDRMHAESINQLCARLEPRRATVIKMRSQGFSLREISRHLEVSPERARQIEASAISELQKVCAGCGSVQDLPEVATGGRTYEP